VITTSIALTELASPANHDPGLRCPRPAASKRWRPTSSGGPGYFSGIVSNIVSPAGTGSHSGLSRENSAMVGSKSAGYADPLRQSLQKQ